MGIESIVGSVVGKVGGKLLGKALGGGKKGQAAAPVKEKSPRTDFFSSEDNQSETRKQQPEFTRQPTQGGSFFAPPDTSAKSSQQSYDMNDPDQFSSVWYARLQKFASGQKL